MNSPVIRSSSGMTLVGALVMLAVVPILALALIGFLVHARQQEAFQDYRLQGDQVMVQLAAQMQEMPFTYSYDLCTTSGALDANVTGACTIDEGTKLNPSAVLKPASPEIFNIRRGWDGSPLADGPICVELTRCVLRAFGAALDVTIIGYWRDPSNQGQLVRRTLEFRKAR